MIDSSVDYKNLPRPTWAEIDIDAILNNINEYKKALGNKVEIIVAAKGNGYGHGMLPIVKAINELDNIILYSRTFLGKSILPEPILQNIYGY